MKITPGKTKKRLGSGAYRKPYFHGEPPKEVSSSGPAKARVPIVALRPGLSGYPKGLGSHGPVVFARGNLALLERRLIGMFSSVRASGSAILRAIQWARTISSEGIAVVSGFHAPLERECLGFFLQKGVPLIVYAAREIEGYRLPSDWGKALEDGKLLVLSSCKGKRISAAGSSERNRLVFDLASEIVVLHAEPGSKTERLAREAPVRGKPLRLLRS